MRIYQLGMYENPTTDRVIATAPLFAHYSAVGTWIDDGTQCDDCVWHGQTLSEPLLVQWEPSSEAVGDFSWDGPFGYVFLVTQRVAEYLRRRDIDCEFLSVEYVTPESSSNPRCPAYPHTGPKQFWGKCDRFVDLDMEASEVHVKLACVKCNRLKHTFKNRDIVVRRRDWHGEKMFRISTNGASLATFVTEEGCQRIQAGRFSNVAFSFAGEIVK